MYVVGCCASERVSGVDCGHRSVVVEPVFGVFGACAVTVAQPLLVCVADPRTRRCAAWVCTRVMCGGRYALAFAGGAMVFVVFDDIVHEGHAAC